MFSVPSEEKEQEIKQWLKDQSEKFIKMEIFEEALATVVDKRNSLQLPLRFFYTFTIVDESAAKEFIEKYLGPIEEDFKEKFPRSEGISMESAAGYVRFITM